MAKEKRVLAFDFGASTGRAMIGCFDGTTIRLEEIHRFTNQPVTIDGRLCWDIRQLWNEIKIGLKKASLIGFVSVGIDTWGVDFGLIGYDGVLLENPVHYRDSRTNGMMEESFQFISKERFYQITGNQFMKLNTVFQLFSLQKTDPLLLEKTDKLLLMPDLFNYMLTGEKRTESTIASTTQLMDTIHAKWSDEVLDRLHISKRLFTDIVPSGTIIGNICDAVCSEFQISKASVIAVASHDTASAVVAVPAVEKDFIFISCGTWSLFGTERSSPLIHEKSLRYNLTNEAGFGGTTTFLKNIPGLWLIQESRRQWIREGIDYSYAQLESFALEAPAFQCFIDVNSPEFIEPGDLPQRIKSFCTRTHQYIPQSIGEILRCIYESLALEYRSTLDQMKDCTGQNYSTIHMVGGGTKDQLLCQMTASACNLQVIAGPIEATVLGNVAVQLISLGVFTDITQARSVIAKSTNPLIFLPQNHQEWASAYHIYPKFLNQE